ncbi:PD-(D/E)XK nuclease family protein [Flavobacterium columnare]|uniref:PD-(D/E)XK nuclease family protein n=1 Tax=Flavobacterium columnare TaxID=996 RepID=A0AA94EXP2_9FLAO|nr:PD-(D/E)XK nuclease family protein [Flavobacterium columnare]MCH4831486.1 PD-(D/E)XK nuclease family protein [Flavobacterium columnare]
MITFLDKLTLFLFNKYSNDLENIVIVLPNKRARVFLLDKIKQYFSQYAFAPTIISIEEFIQDLAGIRPLDNIELLFAFYDIYLEITPIDEQQDFEQFSNWAKILLQDFNEIDRYLIKPNYVFSYLKEIEVLKRWNLEPNQKTELIHKQILFWDKVPNYYQKYYESLLSKGVGYQGLIYKEAVENLEFFAQQLKAQKLIFAGFNALNQAEEKIIQHLVAIDKAEILWDIDRVFLNDPHHDAGLFIRKFKMQWGHYKNNPLDWIIDEFSQEKKIEIIGSSKSIGQSKIVSNIIQNIVSTDPNSLNKVALVLGDENLLVPTLHSLPEEVSSLNITMGYSARNNPIQILLNKLFKMHTNAIQRNATSYVFYYKDILDILSNPIIESFLKAKDLIQIIKKNNLTFITQGRLLTLHTNSSDLFNLLFERWDGKALVIAQRLGLILLHIKQCLSDNTQEDKITKTFLYAIYKVMNKLISYCEKNDFVQSPVALYSIYKQIIDLAEVSFEGEPLSGLQIMGVLESRVLDFETVIITSMNEGKFPAGKSTNSFIPYDVKREIGLPTFKEKDAIYTYHFYHLILRAKNIFLIYNTENDGLDGGEKSRFITQLQVEKQPNHQLVFKTMQPEIPTIAYQPLKIEKSEAVMQRLYEIASNKGFSPSALTAYMRNPIQFYFQRILSIRESEEVEENIALNTLGTIIHQTLEELYKPYLDKYLTEESIQQMLISVDDEVYKQFKAVYKEGEVQKGKNLLAYEVAKRNISNFLKQEKKNIKEGDAVKVLKLETTLLVEIQDPRLPYIVKLSGNVDRIEVRNNTVRIIDYKTGKVEANALKITLWDGLTTDLKNEKIIQLLCYALMYQKELNEFPLEVGIISFKNMKAGFMPFGLKVEKEVKTQITTEILESFKTELIQLILLILNQEIAFEETIV